MIIQNTQGILIGLERLIIYVTMLLAFRSCIQIRVNGPDE